VQPAPSVQAIHFNEELVETFPLELAKLPPESIDLTALFSLEKFR
jgi:hypothetical protein